MHSRNSADMLRSRNRFSNAPRRSRLGIRPWAQWLLSAAAFATALACVGCNSTETPAADPVITIISPIGGSFKMSEPMRIIVRSDYSKFTSGLNYQLSVDSSKNWVLMKANVRKDGIALDTLDWDPVNDTPGSVPAGKPLLFRVIDYNKKHFAVSAYFTLTN
jgi:hypothetical protein